MPGGVDADHRATAVLDRVEHGVVLDRRTHDRAPTPPITTALSDSVPHPVNTISPGRTPASSATSSRASSIALRASRAKRCEPLGLAKRSEKNGSIASTATGRIGVVAAWSR